MKAYSRHVSRKFKKLLFFANTYSSFLKGTKVTAAQMFPVNIDTAVPTLYDAKQEKVIVLMQMCTNTLDSLAQILNKCLRVLSRYKCVI